MLSENKGDRIEVGLRWIDDDSPAVLVDQFILQHVDNQFHLIVGHAPFPLVLGTPEEIREAIEEMGSVAVRVRGRFVMRKSVLQNLRTVLNERAEMEGW